MPRRWVRCVVLVVFVVTGACSSSDEPVNAGGGDSTEGSAVDGTTQDSVEEQPDGSGSESVDSEVDDSEVDDSESGEARFDPLPIPADLDQVTDVFASMLGPTDDFAAQVQRVAPDHPPLPTPPGAEIVLVRMSFSGVSGDPNAEQQKTTRVVMTSTMAPAELAASMDQAIQAEHPDWQVDPPTQFDVVADQLLKYDLPDVEQIGGEQNLTADLKVAIEPMEGGGSEVAVSRSLPEPAAPPSGAYAGWESEVPAVDGAVHSGGSIAIEKGSILKLSATHHLGEVGLTDYRDDYLAFLAAEGLTIESENPNQDRIEFSLGGHPRFDTLTVRACCSGDGYRGSTTFTSLITVEL